MTKLHQRVLHWLGADPFQVSHSERLFAGGAAMISVATCWLISIQLVGAPLALLTITPSAAAAILLFAVPHATLSQPWPAIGGQVISALIGVACAQTLSPPWLAGSVALGLALSAMYYMRCLHPPGAATALLAINGGDSIQALGFSYAFLPIMVNALILVICALLFNNLLSRHRYPAAWTKKPTFLTTPGQHGEIKAEHLHIALAEMDRLEDIAEEDLLEIITRAQAAAARKPMTDSYVDNNSSRDRP